MKYLIILAILLLSTAGCEKRCTQLNVCNTIYGGPAHSIIGYYANDVDTQIFITYKPNGRFDQPVDSYAYINEDVVRGYIYNETDTQYLSIHFSGNTAGTNRVNDLRLIVPGVRTFAFTEIMVDGNYYQEDEFKCSNGSFGCSRNITSLKVDGVYHDFSDPTTDHRVLHK